MKIVLAALSFIASAVIPVTAAPLTFGGAVDKTQITPVAVEISE